MKRTIIIGDVHGCIDELRDLLEAAQARPEDELISVGDLIYKGPDSRAVMEWAINAPNLRCVQGNHEARFISFWRQGRVPCGKPHDLETYRQFGEDFDRYMRYAETWPLYIAREDVLVVHAGLNPREPRLDLQDAEDFRTLRRLDNGDGAPWYEEYEEPRLVVFGHWAKREPMVRPNAIGIDTGCVYGGRLTALILPERKLVSVPARGIYNRKDSWVYDSPAPSGKAAA